MHLIYIDESGNTGTRKDPDQPHHLIAGLIVPEEDIRNIEDAVDGIMRKHFAVQATSPDFELHGADLYSGNGAFRGVPPIDRIAAIHDTLDVLAGTGAKVVWASVDKIRMRSSWHPHQLAFLFLVERVEDYLRSQEARGLLIADECKEVEDRLIENLRQYKKSNTGWGWRPTPIKQIVDSIHFVQSKNNLLIQCVDLVAYFALKFYRQNVETFDTFMALPEPKPAYQDHIASRLTAKRKSVDEIGRKIQALTVVSKTYPT
ncbi:DUF3800 domain-containing protein [Methylorubrum sp. Q1]|uniref:DUF3800 domain-containing protein n=1 Tax=Methylorubrum sp. Q1 TaxID=2562453 RepID=UPI001075D77F|nr:DUF3800 domain-containing protein [Methylorubrum sp. Q1]TFZ61110.1 DUF3800 domain-containing protein [Methylorubrum sp. Q1]